VSSSDDYWLPHIVSSASHCLGFGFVLVAFDVHVQCNVWPKPTGTGTDYVLAVEGVIQAGGPTSSRLYRSGGGGSAGSGGDRSVGGGGGGGGRCTRSNAANASREIAEVALQVAVSRSPKGGGGSSGSARNGSGGEQTADVQITTLAREVSVVRRTFQTTFLLKLPLGPTARPGSTHIFNVNVSVSGSVPAP
jgi:hypothetical protein